MNRDNSIEATIARSIRFITAKVAINISASTEHRANFIIQIFGGMALELGFVMLWFMMFKRYPVINGWTFVDTALLLAVGWGAIDLVLTFAYGILDLAAFIENGSLDQYLIYPIHPLLLISLNKFRPFTLGTCVTVTYLLMVADASWGQCLRYPLMLLLGAAMYLSFLIIIQSAAFFIGRTKRLSNQLMFLVINLLYIPPTVYDGSFRIVAKTVIPVFFVAILPAQLVKQFCWSGFGLLVAVVAGTSCCAVWFFNRGLRKYESG